MKFNKWTMGLAAVGVVSLASAARADETQMDKVNTALSHTTLSGYVDVAAVWRPGTDNNPRTDYYNVPSGAKNDGFYLNAIDLALDKPLDESPWAAGYHVELMAGPDAVPGISYNSTSYNSTGVVSIRQAYIALRTPVGNSGIDWKVGVWDTIIGYESSSDPLNPNYTRSYGYSMEPTTHTGILATYKVNDMVTLQAGIADNVNGINNMSGYESQKAYMAAIAFTAPDSAGFMKGATFNAGIVHSIDSYTYGHGTMDNFYAGVTVPTPVSALKVGAAFDFYDHHDQSPYNNNYNGNYNGINPSDDSAWVAGLYANYQINDKASVNLRGEYLHDDGEGLYANYAGYSSYNYNGYFKGYSVNAEEVTATVQYQLWANVLSRVEFRWDHVEHGNQFGSGNYSSSEYYYNNATRANDFMLALNLIYQF